jgi:hypothetical protein
MAFLIPLAAYEDVSPRDGEHAQLERCQVLGHGQNENKPLNQPTKGASSSMIDHIHRVYSLPPTYRPPNEQLPLKDFYHLRQFDAGSQTRRGMRSRRVEMTS